MDTVMPGLRQLNKRIRKAENSPSSSLEEPASATLPNSVLIMAERWTVPSGCRRALITSTDQPSPTRSQRERRSAPFGDWEATLFGLVRLRIILAPSFGASHRGRTGPSDPPPILLLLLLLLLSFSSSSTSSSHSATFPCFLPVQPFRGGVRPLQLPIPTSLLPPGANGGGTARQALFVIRMPPPPPGPDKEHEATDDGPLIKVCKASCPVLPSPLPLPASPPSSPSGVINSCLRSDDPVVLP
jgi:hypothetical protein